MAALAPHHEAPQPDPHVGVDLVELLRCVPGAEVIAPAAKHRIEIPDEHTHVLDLRRLDLFFDHPGQGLVATAASVLFQEPGAVQIEGAKTDFVGHVDAIPIRPILNRRVPG